MMIKKSPEAKFNAGVSQVFRIANLCDRANYYYMTDQPDQYLRATDCIFSEIRPRIANTEVKKIEEKSITCQKAFQVAANITLYYGSKEKSVPSEKRQPIDKAWKELKEYYNIIKQKLFELNLENIEMPGSAEAPTYS